MAEKKELIEKSQKALLDFMTAANLLLNDKAPYDVNELASDAPFIDTMKDIASDMGVEWESMTHDQSNGIVINTLAELFYMIKPIDGYKAVLKISLEKEK